MQAIHNLKINKKEGLTLTEILASFALGALLVGIVLSMWYFAYRNWAVERIRTRLRIDLEVAIENIKKEVRLSNSAYMSFYRPTGDTAYRAISFPMATPDGNGFLTLIGEEIYWDKSVIYHVYDNPSTGYVELRRTEFTDNNTVLTDQTLRETQLLNVVANGDGSGGPNDTNTTTKVILERLNNLQGLKIVPTAQTFDGYSPTVTRSENIEFGSIRLEAGDHTFKYEVVDQNPSSTGFRLGIDTISITPSGGAREAEIYTPVASSGDGDSVVFTEGWSGNNYFEYNADATSDYVTFQLAYDAWVESNFNNAILDNTVLTGSTLYIKLATPKEGGAISWFADAQTGVDSADYPSVGGEPSLANMAIRNVLLADNIETDGELVRIKFVAHSTNDFVITEAWIVERSAGDDGTGTAVQLFFSDTPTLLGEPEPDDAGDEIGGTVGVTPTGITITANHYVWSNWAVFAIDETKDYLVTFFTSNGNVIYWNGTSTNSYYSDMDAASSNTWNNSTASNAIYAVGEMEVWTASGTVTSAIYDTKIADPAYNQLAWSYSVPAGTSVEFKTRSSDDEFMSGATAWSAIIGSSLNPQTLAIGTGRYVQFQATLSTTAPYSDFPWIDNVIIDWPGESKLCQISGYFTQKPDYGIIKLTVDGQDLTKGLEFTVTVQEEFRSETYEATLTSEVEPRNSGK